MTRDSELKSLARHFLETSKEVLKEDGYLSPLLIARAGKKAIVYSLPHDKESWLLFAMTILRTLGAKSYFVAGEAWAVAMSQLVESLPPSGSSASLFSFWHFHTDAHKRRCRRRHRNSSLLFGITIRVS